MLDKVEIQETISLYHEAGSTTDWDQMMATFLPTASGRSPPCASSARATPPSARR